MTVCSVNKAASSQNWYWDNGGDGPEKTLAKAARGGDVNGVGGGGGDGGRRRWPGGARTGTEPGAQMQKVSGLRPASVLSSFPALTQVYPK